MPAGTEAPIRDPDPPFLDSVQQAVVEGRRVTLAYVAGHGRSSTRLVDPLGLAVKGSVWYLVAGTEDGMRTFRLDRITSSEMTDDPVERPPDFDLSEAWQSITKEVDEWRTPARARATVDPTGLSLLRFVFGKRLRIGPALENGRVEVELGSSSTRALAGEIAGFGRLVEVLEPEEIRTLLAEIGSELETLYGVAPQASDTVEQ